MSLKAHYKFNDNGQDSIGTNHLSHTMVGSYVTGKIDKAFEGNGTGGQMTMVPSASGINLNSNIWSFSVWAKPDRTKWSTTAERFGLFELGTYYTLGETAIAVSKHDSTVTSKVMYLSSYSNQVGNSIPTSHTHTDAELDGWILFVLRCDGSTIYYDSYSAITGVWIKTSTARLWDNITYPFRDSVFIGGYGWDPDGWRSEVDEFKAFDHCLSEKELRELSRAKILHYTFNDFQETTTNEYADGNFAAGTTHPINSVDAASGVITDPTSKFSTKVFRYMPRASTQYNGRDITVAIGDKYSVSMWCYVSVDCDVTTMGFYCEGGYANSVYYNLSNKGKWQLLKIENRATTTTNARILAYALSSFTTGHILFTNIQFEKRALCSEFTATSRTGLINDISGYNNHSNVLSNVNTPQWVTTGKLSGGSYSFTPLSNVGGAVETTDGKYIECSSVKMIEDSFTVAFWTYKTADGYQGGSYLTFGQYANGGIDCRDSVFDLFAGVNRLCTVPMNATLNVWEHHAFVFNRRGTNILKHYINGVFSANGTEYLTYINDSIQASRSLRIGSSIAGGVARFFNGIMDDFRYYATPLTAADILEIYQTRGQLDNNGNLFVNQIDINGFIPTKVDYSGWIIGSSTSQTGWTANGQAGENRIITKHNPIGENDVMWSTPGNDATSDSDGGFTTTSFSVDHKKTYRFTAWLRRENAATGGGNTYFGTNGFGTVAGLKNGIGGATTTNPYFHADGWTVAPLGEWLLYVGYVVGSAEISQAQFITDTKGIWRANGTRFSSSSVLFQFLPETTTSNIRSYLYYSTDIDERMYWYRPRVDLVDGTEPSLTTLLKCAEHRPLVDESDVRVGNLKSLGADGVGRYNGLSEIGITNGMVGFWKLNGDVLDYSGNNYNGTNNGATIKPGVKSKVYSFNGSSNYISIGNASLMMTAGVYSISLWFKKDTTANTQMLICKDKSTTHIQNAIYWAANGAFTFNHANGDQTSAAISYAAWDSTTVGTGWHHVVCLWDGSFLRMYADGVEVSSAATVAGFAYSDLNRHSIGRYGGYNGWYFGGQISDVRIYNIALSAEDVLTQYKHGLISTGMQLKNNGTLYLNKEINEGL